MQKKCSNKNDSREDIYTFESQKLNYFEKKSGAGVLTLQCNSYLSHVRAFFKISSTFLSPYLLVPPFKNVFQPIFISVNNRDRAPSKYVNKLTIVFSSPDPKGHVRYCHHLASVVRRPSVNFSYFNLLL